MCEANAYMLDENGELSLVMESVDKLVPQGEAVEMENIFGQRKTIKARIRELLLVDHKIILEK